MLFFLPRKFATHKWVCVPETLSFINNTHTSFNACRYTMDRLAVIMVMWWPCFQHCSILWAIRHWENNVSIYACYKTRALRMCSYLQWPKSFHVSLKISRLGDQKQKYVGVALVSFQLQHSTYAMQAITLKVTHSSTAMVVMIVCPSYNTHNSGVK